MILVGAQQLGINFASRTLFRGLSFSVSSGERIGLIGPNGAGKSTLLRILAGHVKPDEGQLTLQRGLKLGYLEQVPKLESNLGIRETLLTASQDPHDWREIARADELVSKLHLNDYVSSEAVIGELSGGWVKRVALARELMRQPDLLLLDEPTNHLDVDSIMQMEELLAQSKFATITITHDRLFLQKVATRIIEVNPRYQDGLLSIVGTYTDFLEAREQVLHAQEQRETKLRNTLRREIEWLSRGAKARQTKQKARIQSAYELQDSVDELSFRNKEQSVRLDFKGAERNPQKLIEATGISKRFGGRQIIPPTDLLVTPRSRIGLLGANGCGKSTFIQLLTKNLESDSGRVSHATQLKISYFEQNRRDLDMGLSVQKNICPEGDYVDYAGAKVHVRSYLSRFLFSFEQMDLEVRKLSGGEQSRLMLARLMLQPANLLVLDEPTNDLDIATLDLLAEVLAEFKGAVILVTHDRFFLDQVVNQILAFEPDPLGGGMQILRFADLSQWESWREMNQSRTKQPAPSAPTASEVKAAEAKASAPKKKRLSYKEQRELDSIDSVIEKNESRLKELESESLKPELASNADRLMQITSEMAELQSEIDRLYARWAELSE